MLKSQVVIGGEYMTEVSGNEVRVKVLYEVTDRYSHRTKYMVRRVDNGRDLDKPRGPGVLYLCKEYKKDITERFQEFLAQPKEDSAEGDVAKRILDFLTH